MSMIHFPRYHPERREGSGSSERPVMRKDGFCAVEHCENYATTNRVTQWGYYVRYCHVCAQDAWRLFG